VRCGSKDSLFYIVVGLMFMLLQKTGARTYTAQRRTLPNNAVRASARIAQIAPSVVPDALDGKPFRTDWPSLFRENLQHPAETEIQTRTRI
jgi:hypothetical protein